MENIVQYAQTLCARHIIHPVNKLSDQLTGRSLQTPINRDKRPENVSYYRLAKLNASAPLALSEYNYTTPAQRGKKGRSRAF